MLIKQIINELQFKRGELNNIQSYNYKYEEGYSIEAIINKIDKAEAQINEWIEEGIIYYYTSTSRELLEDINNDIIELLKNIIY